MDKSLLRFVAAVSVLGAAIEAGDPQEISDLWLYHVKPELDKVSEAKPTSHYLSDADPNIEQHLPPEE